MTMRKFALLVAVTAVGRVGIAQQAAFEVATIKPTARTDGAWHLNATADGYSGMDVSLLQLVAEAYRIYDPKLIVGGPAWIDREKFDLEAKFNPAETPEAKNLNFKQRAAMLQPLLAERFNLKVHLETRVFPVYTVVVAKGGLKMQVTKPEDVRQLARGPSCVFLRSRPGYMQGQGCKVTDLLLIFGGQTGRTVVDKTGSDARYSFELRWAPENTPPDSPLASAPSIFTALQEQLGLKLEPATAPLEVLVIDSAEKPSAN